MNRRPLEGRTWLIISCLITGILVFSCSSSDDPCETDPESCESPTPDTGLPTGPLDDWFQLTALGIGDETQGVDLNGDGTIDNGFPALLQTLADTLSVALEKAICPDGPCDETQAETLAQLQEFLAIAVEPETISWALTKALQEGSTTYLLYVEGDSVTSPITLTYTTTAPDPNAGLMCVQDGTLDSAGHGLFGPCDMLVSPSGSGTNGSIDPWTFYLAYTEIQQYSQASFDFIGGGVLPVDALESVIELTLTSMSSLAPDPLPVDMLMLGVRTVLSNFTDFDVDGDGEPDGFTVGITGTAEALY